MLMVILRASLCTSSAIDNKVYQENIKCNNDIPLSFQLDPDRYEIYIIGNSIFRIILQWFDQVNIERVKRRKL